MKKILALIMILALFVLASCGTTQDPVNTNPVTADITPEVTETTEIPVSTDEPTDVPTEPVDNTTDPSIEPSTDDPTVPTDEVTTDVPTDPVVTDDATSTPDDSTTAPEPTTTDVHETTPPVTEPPVTNPPVTNPPVTEPPVTEPTHVHSYTTKVVAPTCTEKGYTLHTCSCGETYKDTEKAALGHNYGNWVVTKEPTTTAEGKRVKTCTRCNNKVEETIPKLTPAEEQLEFKGTNFTVKISKQNMKVGDAMTVTLSVKNLNAAALGVVIKNATGTVMVQYAEWITSDNSAMIKDFDANKNMGAILYDEDTVSGNVFTFTIKANEAANGFTLPVELCAKTRTGTEYVFDETVNITLNISK